MFGNDQVETLAECLLRGEAEQCGSGAVPAGDRPRAVCIDDGISDLIEKSSASWARSSMDAPFEAETIGSVAIHQWRSVVRGSIVPNPQ